LKPGDATGGALVDQRRQVRLGPRVVERRPLERSKQPVRRWVGGADDHTLVELRHGRQVVSGERANAHRSPYISVATADTVIRRRVVDRIG